MTLGAVSVPTLLVMCACALLAIAVLAPRKPLVPASVSLAPPVVERAPAQEPRPEPFSAPPPPEPPAVAPEPWTWASIAASEPAAAEPCWPQLVDPAAANLGAAERLDLVDALAALRRPWAAALLARALDEEPDPGVRAAIAAALV